MQINVISVLNSIFTLDSIVFLLLVDTYLLTVMMSHQQNIFFYTKLYIDFSN